MIDTIERQPAICIDQAKWGAAMMRYRLANLRFDSDLATFKAMPEEHDDYRLWHTLIDQSADEVADARRALLDMPAPELSALRWKLDHVITFEGDVGDDEYMESWSRDYVEQAIADYKRLLPAA